MLLASRRELHTASQALLWLKPNTVTPKEKRTTESAKFKPFIGRVTLIALKVQG